MAEKSLCLCITNAEYCHCTFYFICKFFLYLYHVQYKNNKQLILVKQFLERMLPHTRINLLYIVCSEKKWCTWVLVLISANVDRFSKFLPWQILKEILSATANETFISPELRCYIVKFENLKYCASKTATLNFYHFFLQIFRRCITNFSKYALDNRLLK